MKLSIVIPVFNKFNFTKSCINDLSRLDEITHEIVIVNDGSSDETHDEMMKFMEANTSAARSINIAYIRNESNSGFAYSCNKGYLTSTGDAIMFLNNDIKVKSGHANWTSRIIAAIKDDVLVGPTGGYVEPKKDFQFQYETNDPNKKINYMSGWCLSANRKTFDKLIINNYQGPFSEEFGKAYYEDTDLGLRATRLNIQYKLVDIPLTHFGKITSSQINVPKLYGEARKIFLKKWSGKTK